MGEGEDKPRCPSRQNRLCMRRFRRLPRISRLKPDNDPSPAPFGAFAPNAAQAAIIALAQRTRLKRGAFRPMLSRLVNLLRAGPLDVAVSGRVVSLLSSGQRHRARRAVQSRLQYRRAGFPARAYARPAACSSMSAPMSAPMRMALARHVGARGKVIAIEPHPGDPCAAGFQQRSLRLSPSRAWSPPPPAPSDGELMIETDGDNLGASHIVTGEPRAMPSRCRRCGCSASSTRPACRRSMR